MLYYGTSLDAYGHYTWELTDGLYRAKRDSEIPFDPYEYKNNKKGHTTFVQTDDYTALHIVGSPKDTRGGTISVFWVNGSFSETDFIKMLKSNKTAMELICAMPFAVEI